MQAVVNVVLPVFTIILLGFVAGRFRLLGEASSEALNRFVYFIALPVLLFHSMARVDPAEIFNWPFVAAYAGGQGATFALGMFVVAALYRRKLGECSLFGMASIFGNTGYMGIPLAITAFGDDAGLPAAVATVFGSVIVIAVVTALVEMSLAAGGARVNVATDVLAALLRNPLIAASAAGIGWSLTGVALPAPVDKLCGILGAAAGPCALFAIGLFLVGKPVRRGASEVGAAVAFKLIVHPLITWWLATRVFDVEPLRATVAILMAALPTGANVFVLAQRYGVYVERASTAILVSTVISVLTLSLMFSVPDVWIR